MEAFVYGLSIFIGLVAGVIVSLLTELVKNRIENEKDIKNLRFELNCNLKKIERWLSVIGDLKIKNSEDRLPEFYGYFNFSLTIYSTYFKMFSKGTIYNCLTDESIERLQEVANSLNMNAELLVNGQIGNLKQASYSAMFNKKEATRQIETWEFMLKKCEDNTKQVIKEFEKK